MSGILSGTSILGATGDESLLALLEPSDIRTAQGDLNRALQADGCRPIAQDGLLGPETCGAYTFLARQGKAWPNITPGGPPTWEEACAGRTRNYTCGLAAPVVVPPEPIPTAPQPAPRSSMGLLAVGAAAILLGGAYLAFSKKSKRKAK